MVRLKFIFFFTTLLVPCALVPGLRAQVNEGILLGTQPLSSDARGTAMGGNLISAADGIDALDYNPAALAPIASREFTISGFNRDYNSNAGFLGSSSTSQFDAGALSSIGFASPFPTVQGHFATAISFDRVRDYTSAYSFSAVNPSSSYFNTKGFLTEGGSMPLTQSGTGNRDYLGNYNLAYALGLTYDVPDSGAFTLAAPSYAGMLQSGNVTTEGGLNAVRIGGGIDVAPTISLGVTANILFGTYDFMENYSETNSHNPPIVTDTGTAAPAGFQSATITSHLHQDQSGGSLKFGFLADEKIFKIGATIETPQVLHIDETSSQTGFASFANGDVFSSDQMSIPPIGAQTYDIVTPWKFGAGASVHILGLVGSASVSYVDMASLAFTNTEFDMSALNSYASDSLRGVLSYQLGAEYKFLGISLRAGYSFEASPYKGDPTNYGITAISGGLGFALTKYVDLEAAIRYSTYHTNHAIYLGDPGGTPGANITDDAVSRDDMSLTFSYRY